MTRFQGPIFITAAAAIGLGVVAVPCPAQDPAADEGEGLPLPGSDLTFSVDAGYQFIAETDLNTTGMVDIARLAATLKGRGDIARDWRLELNLRFQLSEYGFTGATTLDPLNGDPWDDIQTIQADARLEWWMINDVAMFFGPFVMASRESSADWDDAATAGGFVGFMFISSENLVWGGGLGVSTQIKDDLLIYPILVLDWQINDQLKLSSVAGPVGLTYTGLELIYDFGHGLELGLGFRYEFRRFRLGSTGFGPNGVGEDTSLPVWVRLSYEIDDNFQLDVYGGFVSGGSFKVDDFNGRPLTQDDYEATPTLAVALRFTF